VRSPRLPNALRAARFQFGRVEGHRVDASARGLEADEFSLVRPSNGVQDSDAVTRHLIRQPSTLWADADLDGKQRLQKAFFPEGVTFTREGFGTTPSISFFNMLEEFTDKNDGLASPTGFEPVLPP
jgi:hypothetical protein